MMGVFAQFGLFLTTIGILKQTIQAKLSVISSFIS